MNILGISYGFGEPSACLVIDGRAIIAVAASQLRPDLAPDAFPERAIDRCLEEVGLRHADIDHVALSMRPTRWNDRVRYAITRRRQALSSLRGQLRGTRRRMDALTRWLNAHHRPLRWPKVHLLDPVGALAEGSFVASGFENASILCMHAGVEWNTDYLGQGGVDGFHVFHQSQFPHSLGLFCESISAFCGFARAGGIGRVAGLATCGDPERHRDVLADVVSVDRAGRVRLDLSFFSREALADPRHRVAMPFAPKLAQTFGRSREAGGAVLAHHQDVAAAAQQVLESRLLTVAEALHDRSGHGKLVFAGDLARNAALNGRLLRDGPFDELYTMPAPGRRGLAIAAALAVSREVEGWGHPEHELRFLGPRYDDGRMRQALAAAGFEVTNAGDVVASVAERLAAGQAVGWFEGAAEHGPVPLGHRSILCAPRAGEGVRRLQRAKARMAPIPPLVAVLESMAPRLFDLPRASPWGELVAPVRPEHQASFGTTARVQTVGDATPRFARLLEAMGQQTDLPVLLHTSLNRTGERPAESPEEAVALYRELELDALVLGPYLVTGPAS